MVMRGALGLRLDVLGSDHLKWIREKLTLNSIPYKDNEPITARAYHEENGYLWVPRYFNHLDWWPKVKTWEWVAPPLSYPLQSNFTADPARKQPEAIEALEDHLRQFSGGIGVIPTGIGKTWMSLEVARRFNTPIGILVYSGHMIDNWVEHCEKHLGIPKSDVGLIKENRCDIGKPVTIISIQTILSRTLPDAALHQFGFIVADECLTGDALITTNKGQVPIADIPSSGASSVLCYDEHGERWCFRRIKRWLPQNRKNVLTLMTAEGSSLKCTANHPLLTQRGWTRAENLKPGDKIISPARAEEFDFPQRASLEQASRKPQLASAISLPLSQPPNALRESIRESASEAEMQSPGCDSFDRSRHQEWTTSFLTITNVAIDRGPGERVYDLEIEEHHNFVANGFLVHNCHHYGAAKWGKVITKFPARYRLAISADPIRDDGLDPIVRWNFGKVAFALHKRPTGELPLVCLVRYPVEYPKNKYHDWKQKVVRGRKKWVMTTPNAMKYAKLLMNDKKRNSWLVDKIIDVDIDAARDLAAHADFFIGFLVLDA